MNKSATIHRIVSSIIESRDSDWRIMEKFRLDPIQMVFLLGKLAEKRQISFRRMTAFVENLMTRDTETVESCLGVIKTHFSAIWGVMSMIREIEIALANKKSIPAHNIESREALEKFEWFSKLFPDVHLHPAVAVVANIQDIHCRVLPATADEARLRKLVESRTALKLYARHHKLFGNLQDKDACRLWHIMMLELFARYDVRYFRVATILDIGTCDVCLQLANTVLEVQTARNTMAIGFRSKSFFPEDRFPVLVDVESLKPEDKARILGENRWFLPPFCENCRCVILPA